MSGTGADLDDVFVEIGEVGRSQIITLVLLSVLNILSGTAVTNYMISAGTLDYRWVAIFYLNSNSTIFHHQLIGWSVVWSAKSWNGCPKKWTIEFSLEGFLLQGFPIKKIALHSVDWGSSTTLIIKTVNNNFSIGRIMIIKSVDDHLHSPSHMNWMLPW